MKRKISILGSTGSIGRQALEVLEKLADKFEIIALAGGKNSDLLNQQIAKFRLNMLIQLVPKRLLVQNIKL